ncbi:MAG: GNAT family N-acetyltransferase [Bdellovibrio sp.]|nr:GNAT family N-acetyltransferase [Bdellovibrio sp.]
MSDYRFKRLSEKNLNDYILIFKEVFGESPDRNSVIEKFDSPLGYLKYFGFIAYDLKNNPAAYYGIFPVQYNINGRDVWCAQSGSTMTRASHRGKGLFSLLAKETYRVAEAEGIEFVFGIPNEFSYPGFCSLKWTFSKRMVALVLPVITFKWLSRTKINESFYFPTEQIKKINQNQRFSFFKTYELDSTEAQKYLSQLPMRPLSFYDSKLGFLLVRKNICLWVKRTSQHNLAIGDVIKSAETESMFTSYVMLYIACMLKGFKQIRFYCTDDHPILSDFKLPWLKKLSLNFGFLILKDKSYPQKDPGLRITYGDYDTF